MRVASSAGHAAFLRGSDGDSRVRPSAASAFAQSSAAAPSTGPPLHAITASGRASVASLTVDTVARRLSAISDFRDTFKPRHWLCKEATVIKLGCLVSILAAATTAAANPHIHTAKCGTPQVVPEHPVVEFFHADGDQRVIYLNKDGGTFTIGGGTNSATNTVSSQIANRSGTAIIPPLEAGFNWNVVRQCVIDHYKRFNIRIVESEPTSGNYVEAIVGGSGQELGFGGGDLFGIAGADNFCNVTERGIAFTFSATHQGVPQSDKELCATIAHEVGHLIALEHETLATDLMSYVLVSESGTKAFVDQNSQCGVAPGQTNGCSCNNTGGVPNSGKRLAEFLDLRPTETNPPVLTVTSPGSNRVIAPSFEVIATATDAEGMADVRVFIGDKEVGNSSTAEADGYHITGTVAEGTYTMRVIARDLAGNEDTETLEVTARKLGIGEDCVANGACSSNICAIDPETGGFCTQACDASNDTCPDGFACDGASSVCAPDGGDGGGCCSVGNDRDGAIAMLFALGVGGVILRRRRQRR